MSLAFNVSGADRVTVGVSESRAREDGLSGNFEDIIAEYKRSTSGDACIQV
jgi:hypothetical protein